MESRRTSPTERSMGSMQLTYAVEDGLQGKEDECHTVTLSAVMPRVPKDNRAVAVIACVS